MLLDKEMSDAGNTVYFTLPGQEDYLYEYEGDLDEALTDLPEIYTTIDNKISLEQGETSPQTLPASAIAVLEQIWDYFDQTGEQTLAGNHDYNFQIADDHLLILPKDNSSEVVNISRDGQVDTSFSQERYEHLLERFAIAHQKMQVTESQQESCQEHELG